MSRHEVVQLLRMAAAGHIETPCAAADEAHLRVAVALRERLVCGKLRDARAEDVEKREELDGTIERWRARQEDAPPGGSQQRQHHL